MIALADGARMLVDELAAGAEDGVEFVLGGEPRAEALAAEPSSLHERAFEVVIDAASHPFIASHVVKGTPVLPAMIVLELFARAAQAVDRELVLGAVRDLRVLRGVRLARFSSGGDRFTITCTARPQAAASDVRTFDLALKGEGAALHYTAKVELQPRSTPPGSAAPTLGALAPWTDIVYGDVLFHGPMFHAIEALDGESNKGLSGRLLGRASLGWSDGGWATDPALLDGGLQLAVLWTKHALGGASLPTSVGAYVPHVASWPSGPFRAVASGTAKNRDQAVFDVSFTDASGRPVARLEAVEVSVLPGSRQELEAAARTRAGA
jgi:hypothetical protein